MNPCIECVFTLFLIATLESFSNFGRLNKILVQFLAKRMVNLVYVEVI